MWGNHIDVNDNTLESPLDAESSLWGNHIDVNDNTLESPLDAESSLWGNHIDVNDNTPECPCDGEPADLSVRRTPLISPVLQLWDHVHPATPFSPFLRRRRRRRKGEKDIIIIILKKTFLWAEFFVLFNMHGDSPAGL
ncbi:hypothetical protein KKF97_04910 [Myxococcota bacterium]|nr:hypothetical protein [Myxococcota bacterium]